MRNRHRSWIRAAAAGASLLAAGAARAQDTPQTTGGTQPVQPGQAQPGQAQPEPTQAEPAATQQGEPVDGSDVVVTARKTSERLQDVPISVDAVSGDQLRDRGAVDVKDVLRSVPGFSFSGTERGQSNYNIRGVSTQASSPTVGLYLDDVSLVTVATNFSGAFDPVFFDMERLEVLKGPQGTLYGGSAMGGAIKYVSARPDPSRYSVDAAAGLAATEHGGLSYNAETVANVPLASNLALRVGAFYRHDGGYVDNGPGQLVNSSYSSTPSPTYTPRVQDSLSTRVDKNQNSANTYALRASIEWEPDATWSIRPQLFYQDYELANPGYFFPNQPGLRSSWRLEQPTQDEDGVYSLQVDKTLGAVTLTSLTAYFDRNLSFTRDYSFFVPNILPAPFYGLVYANASPPNVSRSNTETFSQELRLASSGDRRLKWLVGLFYSDQRDRLRQDVTIRGPVGALLGTEQAYSGNTFTGTKQYAAFGEATLTLLDRLDVTAGARVFKIDQTVDIFAAGPLATPADLSGRKSKDSGINPKAGLSFRATPDNLLYASAARGFRPGGPNRFVVSNVLCATDLSRIGLSAAPEDFGPDNVWTYEAGTKNTFGHGRVTINAAAFYTDWSKIQQNITLPACGFQFTTNAGSAEVKGAEVEGRFNLTRAFQVGGTGTLTDTKLKDTVPGTPIQAGDQTLATPKWSATAFADYSAEVADGWRFNLRGEYQYQSRARRDFNRTLPVTYSNGVGGLVPYAAEFRQGYEVVNASASVTNGGTELRLYANNLADKRPLIDYIVNAGSDVATTIRPRTVGVELRQHF